MSGPSACGSRTRLPEYSRRLNEIGSLSNTSRMTRQELEHIIRAAAGTAGVRDIVVIGSQAILGTYRNAPLSLTKSMEADVFPRDDPSLSIVINGAIGELSLFHDTFGYYGHGVDESTAILPEGWRERLVKVETSTTMGAIGWCLETNDLAVSKLAAGRDKDLDFVKLMLQHQLASAETIRMRLASTPRLSTEMRRLAESRVNRLASE